MDPDTDPAPADGARGRNWRPWVAAGAGLLAVVVVIVLAGVVRSAAQDAEPVVLAGVEQPGAATAACASVMAALPDQLGDLQRRATLGDATAAAAWGNPAVVLRCGISDPIQMTQTNAQGVQAGCEAGLTDISGVSWMQISDVGQSTYLDVDRTVRIALTLPDGLGSAPIQDISAIVQQTLPRREPCSGGQLLPLDG
ncbi:DUF3515 domain-containing protein [Nakamurella alba]|uniref:DUF3515 domain-containing protein n=1 Tax=Nakamurella alba TaxID=2665158 RepID=UPI0018AC5005|nr:DUF3515 domain-containing protein [Nakamurella alba]